MKSIPVKPSSNPKAAILTPKMLTGSCLWLCKIISQAARATFILAHFSCCQWVIVYREHRPITGKEILRRVSEAFAKLVSNFQEANKKLIIVYWKTFERPWKPSAHIKKFRPSKKYPSKSILWHCPSKKRSKWPWSGFVCTSADESWKCVHGRLDVCVTVQVWHMGYSLLCAPHAV